MSKRALDLSAALAAAFAAFEQGKLGPARSLARDIVKQRSDVGGAHYLLGLIALRQNQPRAAEEAFARAASFDPTALPPVSGLARALAAQARWADAAAAYDRALTLSPGNPPLLSERAAVRRELGDLTGAEADWRAALSADPALAEAQSGLGNLLRAQGDYDQGLDHLRRAVELAPASPAFLNNLGVALADLGRLDQAAEALSEALRLDPRHFKARLNLAGVERRRKNAPAAHAHAVAARQLDRDHPEVQLMLGLAAKDVGRTDEARKALSAAAKAGRVEALFAQGELCRDLGEIEAAVGHFRAYLDKVPDDRLGASLHLARLGQGGPPDRAPDAFVAQLFDDYAEGFDLALVGKLRYSAPELLRDALAPLLPAGAAIFDAGCGTGLAGAALRPLAGRLDGADLSPRMVEKARARGVYDALTVGDLVAVLDAEPAAFDAVVAADVFVYIGALGPSLTAAATALKPDGLLAFTVERHDGDGFILRESHRYAHSAAHLRQLAEQAGFAVLTLAEATTRQDAGAPVPGYLCVWRKAKG